ncbi:oxidoreductase FAD/NAD(P)-binding [Luminiphilus syltensis NOR5-1B]|uniref:Oxidoreductase FAD/NAD(P)-binding n=2 Tax=Luminiphilus TaxID=1341118 RepID=B8KXU2_9GAMM|nr:oxidoreductase FAD/NAD(P)-binding [Luminiphilus syltensis NOR5-1B]
MLPRRFRVVENTRETVDTYTFSIAAMDGVSEFSFAPGQFNMLYLFGYGEVPISICGDPAQPGLLVHTVRATGSVTQAFASLKAGDMIGVRGPFGSSWPVAAAEGGDVLIVAGGLGLAPLRSAIYRLLAREGRYRRIVILYGARSPDTILFAEELKRWRDQPGISCDITVDYADANWQGRVGVITQLIAQAEFDPQQVVALICGPEIMMRFSVAALKSLGVSDASIHVSLERSMKCALGHCGHCQFGPLFVCKDGPVLPYDQIATLLGVAEL